MINILYLKFVPSNEHLVTLDNLVTDHCQRQITVSGSDRSLSAANNWQTKLEAYVFPNTNIAMVKPNSSHVKT